MQENPIFCLLHLHTYKHVNKIYDDDYKAYEWWDEKDILICKEKSLNDVMNCNAKVHWKKLIKHIENVMVYHKPCVHWNCN